MALFSPINLELFIPELKRNRVLDASCTALDSLSKDNTLEEYVYYPYKDLYEIAQTFFSNFSSYDYSDEELAFAIRHIYSNRGFLKVLDLVAHYAGMEIDYNLDSSSGELRVSISSEKVFDLNFFERLMLVFLEDLLLIDRLSFVYKSITILINLKTYNVLYGNTQIQNNIYLVPNKAIDYEE